MTDRLSRLLCSVSPSATLAVDSKAKALKAQTEGPQATDPATGASIDPTRATSANGKSDDAASAGDPSGALSRPRPPAAPGQPGSVLDVTV